MIRGKSQRCQSLSVVQFEAYIIVKDKTNQKILCRRKGLQGTGNTGLIMKIPKEENCITDAQTARFATKHRY